MRRKRFPFRFGLMGTMILAIMGSCMADSDTLKANIAAEPHLRWVMSKASPPNLFKNRETYAQESPGPVPDTRSTIETQLDSHVSLVFENTHLLEILEYLWENYDINIAVDYRAIVPPPRRRIHYYAPPPDPADVANGIIPRINFQNGSFRNALPALLRPLNLTYAIESSYIWISSPALLEADAARPKPDLNAASEALLASLSVPLTLKIDNVHIEEFIEYVSRIWEVPMVLDSGVVKREHSSTFKPDSLDAVTDGIIPYMRVRTLKVSEALDIALRPLNLTYMADGDILWISSYGRIGKFATPTTSEKPVP